MATNLLVTGSHGGDDPHVESKHDALMHAAMLGRSGYILKTRNWTMKPTAKDANNITIPAWDLVVEGRQIYIAAPTDVNIQSGSQGQKRRDLIVARYALNSGTGVETVTLEAIKGKPSAATPADPGIETGSIIGGAIVSDLPLCRVNLDGITITSIDTLVNVLQPLEDVWDSLTPTVLWEGASGKTGTLPLAESITDFRELIIEGNDDDHYPRLFHTAAEAGSIVLSFVGMNFVNGLASGKATLVRIADTSVQIIGHRIHVMEGNTSDTQCLTITRILGAR